METDLHQVFTDFTGRVTGFGTESGAQGLNDRVENAAPAGRSGRHGGRDDEFGQTDRIAERNGALTDSLNDAESNAAAKPGLNEAAGQEEGADDQPNGSVAKTEQHVFCLQDAEKCAERQRQECDGAHRDRLQNEAGNRGDEDREEMPRSGRQALGNRQEPDDGIQSQHDRPFS